MGQEAQVFLESRDLNVRTWAVRRDFFGLRQRFLVGTCQMAIPIGSMYGIYANIWGILMVNVTIYSIHGSYGIVHDGWIKMAISYGN